MNRVRVFVHPKTERLFVEYYESDPLTGASNRVRVALGHADREKAKKTAESIAATLRQAPAPQEPDLTLGLLFDTYESEVTPLKSRGTQGHDRRTLGMFRQYFGPHRLAISLDGRDWDNFIRDRRAGTVVPVNPTPKRPTGKSIQRKKPIRNRIVQQDLKLLKAVLNWGTRLRKADGEPFLPRNPCAGFPIPCEQSPNRPKLALAEFEAMLKVAANVNEQLPLLLTTAFLTGHRIGAICQLRWSDIDLNGGFMRWRGENDKMGFEHTVPISEELVELFRTARNERSAIGETFVFTSPIDHSRPLPRLLARDWWEKAEVLAKVSHVRGRGWHSLRRLFASELRHSLPLKDLCVAGGWKSAQTVLTCYMAADDDTMRKALDERLLNAVKKAV